MRKFFLLFFFFFLFGFYQNVSAQIVTGGISVSPYIIEQVVKPGQVVTTTITVTNLFDQSQTLYALIKDFKARGEGGEALLLPPGSEKSSLASWVELPKEGIHFDPKETKKIPITIRIPEKTGGGGGHFGAIVFSTTPPEVGGEGEGVYISFVHQVGVLVFLYSPAQAIEEARIREFSTDKTIYGTPFRVHFTIRVENLGNVHIRPYGSIQIKNMLGKDVTSLKVNEEGFAILPESIRRFDTVWEGNFGFGKYTANLVLNFGIPTEQGGLGIRTISSQISFWIIPWKLVAIIILILIALIIGGYFGFQQYKKRLIKKILERKLQKKKEETFRLYTSLILLIFLILIFLFFLIIFFYFFV